MGLHPVYKSIRLEKEKKSFLKNYHIDLDPIHLFINVDFSEFDFESDAHNMSENMLEILQKHITESGKQSIYDRFEESLKEINFFLNDLKSKKETGNIGKINVLIGVLEGTVLYLTKTGMAEAYLLRKGNIIEISEGLYSQKGSENNYFLNIASGDLENGDKILLSSKNILKFVGRSDLNTMFITSAIEEAFRELSNTLNLEETGDILISGFLMAPTEKKTETKTISLSSEETSGTSRKAKEIGAVFLQKTIDFFKNLPENIKNPEKRTPLIIGGIVIVVFILLLSVTSLSNNSAKNESLQKYDQMLQSAQTLLTDARQQKIYDKLQSKATLNEAKNKALEVYKSGVFYKDAHDLLQEIQQEEESMDNIIRVENPIVTTDLSKKNAGVDSQKLIYFNQSFYVLTPRSIIGPVIDSAPDSYDEKTIENGLVIVGGDKFIDRNNIVMLAQPNKLVEYKDGNFNYMDTEDSSWKTGIDIKTYASKQNIYILDPVNNNIWKYARTNKLYQTAQPYITDNADIKDALSFAIDGNIYVLKKSGEIVKLFMQKKQKFAVEGEPSIPLSNLDTRSKIFTSENLRNIYISDPTNQRVLVYKKMTFENPEKIVYDRQYIFKDTEIRDIFIDDAEQNLYVLTPQKIMKVDIKGIQ